MGILDKVRQVRESVEEKMDERKMKAETEASAERIQRNREITEKEKSGRISPELAEERRQRAAKTYERQATPIPERMMESAKSFIGNPAEDIRKGREKRAAHPQHGFLYGAPSPKPVSEFAPRRSSRKAHSKQASPYGNLGPVLSDNFLAGFAPPKQKKGRKSQQDNQQHDWLL